LPAPHGDIAEVNAKIESASRRGAYMPPPLLPLPLVRPSSEVGEGLTAALERPIPPAWPPFARVFAIPVVALVVPAL
jgi:hypothetical protein